jgi:tripartite-type tricarboxylate transporter receptor subunit TctC
VHAAFRRASATERFRQSAAGEGLVPALASPAATEAIHRAEVQEWRQVVEAQSIQMD